MNVSHYPMKIPQWTSLFHLAFFVCDGEALPQTPPWPQLRAGEEGLCVGGGRFLFLVCVRVWEAHGPP